MLMFVSSTSSQKREKFMSSTNKIYESWKKNKFLPKDLKADLSRINKKEINVFFKAEKMHFGTAGIRGIMGAGTHKMNIFTYQQMAEGYAKYIVKHFPKQQSVVIGHDNRMNSDLFSITCANVLTSFGIKVYLFKENHLTPTPIISFAIRHLKTSGGIIVTASHNPKEYNGFKAYNPDGGQILPDVANEIEKLMPQSTSILNNMYIGNDKLLVEIDDKIIDIYFKEAKKALVKEKIIGFKKPEPIILTTHHGTASNYLPKFLKQLNFNVYPVKKQCFVNDKFINSPSSNPEYFNSFDLSIKLAKKLKSKLLIGVDPDADRMAVMIKHNNSWQLITGNQMGIIFTHYLLNNRKYNHKPFIVSSYVSTYYIDMIAKKFKAYVTRTGTGFKWMGNYVTLHDNKESFVVAFEEAIGALCTNINRDKDSFTASALALEINYFCKQKKMDLIDYLEKIIFKEYGTWFGKTDSFVIKDLDWKKIVDQKMKYFRNYNKKTIGNYKINKIVFNKLGDCLEWWLDGKSWIKFRKSGTEPKMKVYYELYGKPLSILNKEYQSLHNFFANIIEK